MSDRTEKTNGASSPKTNGSTPPSSEVKAPFLIGVAGGTASGKVNAMITFLFSVTFCYHAFLFLCNRPSTSQPYANVLWSSWVKPIRIIHCVRYEKWILGYVWTHPPAHPLTTTLRTKVVCISQDSFYRELTASEKLKAEKGLFNFDHPDAFDEDKMVNILEQILAGKKVELQSYDYKTNALCQENMVTIYPADVVLFEGILVFYFQSIRNKFHMKLFVDTDSDTRLARRG